MRVLITGGSGLLGQYLNIQISKKHKILTLYNTNIGNCGNFYSQKIDLLNFEQLENIFNDFKPEIVIHTAALANTFYSSTPNPKKVYDINVNVTHQLAKLCNQYNSKMIYISTDLVYAGYRGSMLKEDAKLIPVSIYAETKLMGEIKIQSTFENYIIFRTALLFGFGMNHSSNHFHKMFFELKEGGPVKLFVDQYRTPISLLEAARVISEVLNLDIKSEILNVGGSERISRYELGEKSCEVSGFDKNLLIKIMLDDIPELPKVEDVSLNTDKLSALGIKRKNLDESIAEIINHSF
jgi:dTDP-4-dehydrorhamnose reductase